MKVGYAFSDVFGLVNSETFKLELLPEYIPCDW